jgi:release factor glutamine methyltransferase
VDHVSFCGLTLLCEPGKVMTPRPATEDLVAAACERLRDRRARIADVGSGSGAIALAIASACPGVEVWATDSNPRAVALTRRNVLRQGLGDRVVALRSDLLAGVPAPVDLVVANLPYLPAVTAEHYPDLEAEPADAVFAPGDGLGPYRRLAEAARDWLAHDGELMLQLHRRVVAVSRADLESLSEALTPLAA